MNILHITPTFFSDQSVIGGGERYALELARAVAAHEPTVLMTFASKKSRETRESLKIVYVKGRFMNRSYPSIPCDPDFFRWLAWADVIHCHQVRTFATDFAAFFGGILGRKKIFITDLGGGDSYAPSAYLPWLHGGATYLLISEYSKKLWGKAPQAYQPRKIEVIYGGIDEKRFTPGDPDRSGRVLFAGRLLPHKGIDVLIDACRPPLSLDIVGNVYHPAYYERLKKAAEGRDILFHHGLSDDELILKYRSALVTVLPSVYTDCYGGHTLVPELLGLTVLESMACGTPAIVTRTASLPEIVHEGETGFIVPERDPEKLRERLLELQKDPERAAAMGAKARSEVLRTFTWKSVAERCLTYYRAAGEKRPS